MKLLIKRLDKNIKLPEYKTKGSAGMDISISKDIVLQPKEIKLVPTGIAIAVEDGYEVQVRPRSGLSCKNGITLINCVGTIDSDYRGEIKVGLVNLGDKPVWLTAGTRVAQMVVNKIEQPTILEVDTLDETERGEGGFGSTGVV